MQATLNKYRFNNVIDDLLTSTCYMNVTSGIPSRHPFPGVYSFNVTTVVPSHIPFICISTWCTRSVMACFWSHLSHCSLLLVMKH